MYKIEQKNSVNIKSIKHPKEFKHLMPNDFLQKRQLYKKKWSKWLFKIKITLNLGRKFPQAMRNLRIKLPLNFFKQFYI